MTDPAGARRALTTPRSPLARWGGAVLALLLVALVVILLVFGDSLFGDGNDDEAAGPEPAAPSESASLAPEDDPEPAAVRQVATVATTVLETWARPDTPYEAWWRDLAPLLTPAGRQAYEFTSPAGLPRLGELTLDGVEVHGPGSTATVYVRAAGDGDRRYGVDLSRRGAGSRWLAQRIVFPGTESMFG
ncbi:hypothetical protein [Nocardioides nanhaiensis]|uniref:Uncharacterized protein n=1 Tax=Nocardioides nanhaiensis TaxID=1476871 RepID=A0ABP8W0V3_9ACTN